MFHGILADHHLHQLLTGATSRTFFWQIVQCVPCPASGVGESKRPGPGLGWWALGCLLLSEGGKTSLNPGHDKVQQCFHSLLDTLSSCCGRLKVGETQLSCHGSASIGRHCSQTLQINLISAEDNVWGRCIGMRCQLVQPVPGSQKALVIGDIKDEKETHSVSEESSGETAKALLSSCVPQLKLDPLTTTSSPNLPLSSSSSSPSYLSLAEVYSHCTDEPWIECVLCVLVEEGGFAHTRVTKGQELDQVVIVHRVCLLLQRYSQITFTFL